MLVQPRGGFPTYKQQYALYEYFVDANVDVLPLTIDSNTRLNDYATAKKMLRLSEENDMDMLNGYPLVTHGYRTTRKMITHFNKPVSLRHGTPDARLLIETAIASGIFEIEGGPITYLLPYSKNFPLDKAFLYWKYVERDIVTGAVLRKLAKHYAEKIHCGDAVVNLVYHQWMGAFPTNKDFAEQLINLSTVIASMVGADKIITKTREEASGIPTREANAKTVADTQYCLRILNGLPKVVDDEEEEILTLEVSAIMEAVFNNPADTLWRKVFNSIKDGTIDVPFSPHIINQNEMITIRDAGKNIRIIERGNVPIPDRCYEYEKAQCDLSKDTTGIVNDIIHDIGIMQ
jgi:glutamate mutase epsilon subunit